MVRYSHSRELTPDSKICFRFLSPRFNTRHAQLQEGKVYFGPHFQPMAGSKTETAWWRGLEEENSCHHGSKEAERERKSYTLLNHASPESPSPTRPHFLTAHSAAGSFMEAYSTPQTSHLTEAQLSICESLGGILDLKHNICSCHNVQLQVQSKGPIIHSEIPKAIG